MSSSPRPLLTGFLGQTPLAELLIQAYDRGLEGTLLLQTADRHKSAVWFFRGAPAKARLSDNSVLLSQVVTDLGLIHADVAAATQKRAEAQNKLHGAVLLDEGLLDQTGLYLALREQLGRQVLALCALPATTGFGFYEENFLNGWGLDGQWRVKPLRVIWRATADYLPAERRAAWLSRLKDTPLRLRPEAPVSRYALSRQEQAIVDVIRVKSQRLPELLESGVGTQSAVEGTVCALLLTRQLDLGFKDDPVGMHEPPETPQSLIPSDTRGTRRSVTVPRNSALPAEWDSQSKARRSAPTHSIAAHDSPISSRPGRNTGVQVRSDASGSLSPPSSRRGPQSDRSSASTEQLETEIRRYQEHPPKNYYEVLGVQRGADSSHIRSAFFQLARRWHPDKLPEALSQFRPIVTKAFSEMGEAHQTLMDDARRAEYDRGLSSVPEDEQEQVAAILRAASAYQRAEILFKKKSYKEALAEAKLAYEGDASQPDHVSLYAWLHTLVHPDEDHQAQIEMMTKVLESTPDHVRTLWYRGQLYKKAQQTGKAVRDFKHIVAVKPKHVDAARELRVHQMRRNTDPKSGPGSQRSGGLFGAFRKKS